MVDGGKIPLPSTTLKARNMAHGSGSFTRISLGAILGSPAQLLPGRRSHRRGRRGLLLEAFRSFDELVPGGCFR
jgi:hypothetical protein